MEAKSRIKLYTVGRQEPTHIELAAKDPTPEVAEKAIAANTSLSRPMQPDEADESDETLEASE